MIDAYSVSQIRAAERVLLAREPEGSLMRRASYAVAAETAARLPSSHPGRRVVLLVGSGNNGGDALFAGAYLRGRGMAVLAVLTDSGAAHPAGLAALRRAGGRVCAHDAPGVGRAFAIADVIVDGLVGLAARPPLRPAAAALVDQANATNALRVAVDLPSGIDPNTGEVDGSVFRADVTVTFGGVKTGLLIADEETGTIVNDSLGMQVTGPPDLTAMTDGSLAGLLTAPGQDADKFTGGLVGIAAGSPGYPGAAVLCVGGAVRTRPGMVRYAGAQASAVLARWPEVVAADSPERAGTVQAWVIGPGLGTDATSSAQLRWVLEQEVPVLVDADGLTVLAGARSLLAERRRAGLVTVLTPHDREFARVFPDLDLANGATRAADRLGAVRSAASASGATVLLKGRRTLVAEPGGRAAVNLSGSSWLATAGSGDVLSGVIGSLLAHGLEPLTAAAGGAFLHGRAGERAARSGLFGAQVLWDHLAPPGS